MGKEGRGGGVTLVDCQEALMLFGESDEVICFLRGWREGLFDDH